MIRVDLAVGCKHCLGITWLTDWADWQTATEPPPPAWVSSLLSYLAMLLSYLSMQSFILVGWYINKGTNICCVGQFSIFFNMPPYDRRMIFVQQWICFDFWKNKSNKEKLNGFLFICLSPPFTRDQLFVTPAAAAAAANKQQVSAT